MSIIPPAMPVEYAVFAEAIDCGKRHCHGVVGIVVRKEALTAEREQAIDRSNPLVKSIEVFAITARVNRVGLREAAHDDSTDLGVHAQSSRLEIPKHEGSEF